MGLKYASAPLVPAAYAFVTASGTIPPENANSGISAERVSTGMYRVTLPEDEAQPTGTTLLFVTPRADRIALATFVIIKSITDRVVEITIDRHIITDVVFQDCPFDFMLFRTVSIIE